MPIASHSGCAARTLATTSATRCGGSISSSRISEPSTGRRTSSLAVSAAGAPSCDAGSVAVSLAVAPSIPDGLYSPRIAGAGSGWTGYLRTSLYTGPSREAT